jgi:predicted nucleotidyltransferase
MEKLFVTERIFPADLLKDIKQAESILLNHGALKNILYGSLARGDYRPVSDIDLCVEGMPDENYFRAVAECLMTIQRPISILDFQDTYGYFSERILREGRILYG